MNPAIKKLESQASKTLLELLDDMFASCDDLYFDSPFGSVYEAFGENCRLLSERGDDCAPVAELLDGPVG